MTPGARIIAELRADPCRSDRAIARAAASDHKYVGRLRKRLESYGAIEPRPLSSPAARRAERELRRDPARSDRLIASELKADHHVVSQTRKRLEQAGDIPRVPPHQRAQRYRNGPRRPGRSGPEPPPPRFTLPPPPDWSRGLCTTAPRYQRSWWTSADGTEREAARRLCAGCPVLAECELWSLALPWDDRSAIYAGLTPGERIRRKREVRDELTRQALKGWQAARRDSPRSRSHVSRSRPIGTPDG
jgi:hypothetical protein